MTARIAIVLGALLTIGCRTKPSVRTDPPATSAAPVPTPSPSASSTPTPPSAPEPSAPLAPAQVTDAGTVTIDPEDAPARVAWVRAREAAAKSDPKGAELVRLPLVHHGPGWGCICPDHYIGTSSSNSGEDPTWIDPVFSPTAPPLPPETVVIVEGYFTGKTTPFAPKTGEEFEPATLHELRVLRHRPVARDPNAEGSDLSTDDARMRVVLAANDAHHETEPPADGKVFLLVAQSIPTTDNTKATTTAERRRADLVTKGFPEAEVIDTRRAPGLFCCHLVVVASRHATASEADAAAKAAKKKGVAVLVRRGW